MSKIDRLEEDLNHAIEDKNDYQQICQDQNNKIAGYKSKEKEMQSFLQMKDAQFNE